LAGARDLGRSGARRRARDALRLTDVLVRRLHLFYEANAHATGVARPVAEKMAGLLGWDAARLAHELATTDAG